MAIGAAVVCEVGIGGRLPTPAEGLTLAAIALRVVLGSLDLAAEFSGLLKAP